MCHPNANLNLIEENVIQTKSGIMINVDGSVKSIIYVRNFFLESCYMHLQNGKFLASINEESVITCDEVIEKTKTVPTNFNEKI